MIREYQESDRAWAEAYMEDEFGGAFQTRRGELIDVLALPGLVAEKGSRPVGLVTYRREDADCELAFIAAFERIEASVPLSSMLCSRPSRTATGSESSPRTTIWKRFGCTSGAASGSSRSGPEPSTSLGPD